MKSIVLLFHLAAASLGFQVSATQKIREIEASTSEPIPPSQDAFYTAPPDYESAAPGTILRIRPAPGNLTTVIGNSSAAYNILYRTTDTQYNPSWAVTTLFVPIASNYTRHNENSTTTSPPLLSYQVPYDSADLDASPSYGMYYLETSSFLGAPTETDTIATALGLGWFVNVPDYEGPLAAFTAGVRSGHATLDSVRASLSAKLGPDAHSRYAMWGYSGGSVATAFASELQAAYAPELAFAGSVVGGPVTNYTSVFNNLTATPFAGLLPSSLIGLTAEYPEVREFLVSRLKTEGEHNASSFLSVQYMNSGAAFVAFAYQNISDYFVGGQADLEAPELARVFGNNMYLGYHGIPQMPVFAYKAIGDEFCSIEDSDEVFNRYCEVGANILYQRNTVGGHLDETTNGFARALNWLTAVLDGTYSDKYPTSGCTIENVTVDIVNTGL